MAPPDPFLNLLGSLISPNLSSGEVARVRGMLSDSGRTAPDDRPWPSGVPDIPANRAVVSQTTLLEQRIEHLELTVVVLCEALAKSGGIDAMAFAERMRVMRHELDARNAAEATRVTCTRCGKLVSIEHSYRRVTGILCEACHDGRRVEAVEEDVERVAGGGYRSPPQRVENEETVACVECLQTIPKDKAYNSGRGPRCQACHVERSED